MHILKVNKLFYSDTELASCALPNIARFIPSLLSPTQSCKYHYPHGLPDLQPPQPSYPRTVYFRTGTSNKQRILPTNSPIHLHRNDLIVHIP